MVTRHWWKLFGFILVLALVHVAGFLAFCVGIFIAAPVAMASLMYAYEDVFGPAGQLADQPSPATGPHGTAVVGAQPRSGGGGWKPAGAIGVALAVLVLVVPTFLIATYTLARSSQHRARAQEGAARRAADLAAAAKMLSFGPWIEQVIQARATGTNQFLDLDAGRLLTPPPEIASALAASEPSEDEDRLWQGLDIPGGSKRSPYITWLKENGADLMFAGDGKLIGFDGIFARARDWDNVRPQQVRDAIAVLDGSKRAAGSLRSKSTIAELAPQLSRSDDGLVASLLMRDQSELWFFKTGNGSKGVLQIVRFTDEPDAVKIRYKLVRSAVEEREDYAARLEAAGMIGSQTEKDKALSVVATDAARAGEVDTVGEAIDGIATSSYRDQAALDAVRLLAKRGLRKEAIQIAQKIGGNTMRDLALSELAQ